MEPGYKKHFLAAGAFFFFFIFGFTEVFLDQYVLFPQAFSDHMHKDICLHILALL